MRTRSQSRNNFPQQKASPAIVEPLRIELPFLEDQFQEDPLEDPPEVPMADNRTMAELFQAPTEGYEDVIVIPEIEANNFELKHGLINLVQNKQFFGHDKEDPHAHIRYFIKITSTMRVPNDSLNSAAGGNFLDKMPRECLKIIESKSKVHQSRAKAVVAKVSTSSSTSAISFDVAKLKDMVNQPPTYQAPAYQAPIPQTQSVSKNDFESYVKANDAVLKNMQNQGSGTLPSNTITNPKEDLKGITTRSGVAYQGPTIPTPSKVMKQGTELHGCLNFHAQIGFHSKALIRNKEKLSEMSRTLMNEHCLAVILNKLPRKLGDPGKFLIPCEFPRMDECLALADLGASINLMPLSVWEGLLLLELTPTCMTLELADRLVSKPINIAKDVSVKVANKIDVIDMACEEYSQEVLGFSDVTASGNPTPYDDPIVSTTSPTLIPFGDSDFLLFEEADAFLDLEDDPNSPKFNPLYYEPEGDILLLEAILNKFCTHKILMEEDYKLAVQHQRRVNPKIYDVIKKEVEKLFDAGLIYPISNSPWVSRVYYVPKKGGFTVVKNEENELIPTHLVTDWRVFIDYRKLNETTRKDHFPLPFMDQMLERLAGNEYYCFLDGFSGYFQIPIDPYDQEKTTFTCPYGTFA
nr:reverse transcriptase domain-containing protein [Tanacetum cinerariifolium]